jgi:hypothetical protein
LTEQPQYIQRESEEKIILNDSIDNGLDVLEFEKNLIARKYEKTIIQSQFKIGTGSMYIHALPRRGIITRMYISFEKPARRKEWRLSLVENGAFVLQDFFVEQGRRKQTINHVVDTEAIGGGQTVQFKNLYQFGAEEHEIMIACSQWYLRQ